MRGSIMEGHRKNHLDELKRDIQNWRRQAEELERQGLSGMAEVRRKWAQSAERLAERIKNLPHS